ncbi:Bromodomain-containing protein [Amylocystis lapponica]|nr:Bromodomain-containing protein [Amylocystis lapponica]
MSKREASRIAPEGVDIDAPRAKRRREAPAAASSPPKEHVATSDATVAVKSEVEGTVVAAREGADAVKEQGLKLWHSVKDAVNKEGRTLSHDFLRLPSKRQYPDYYQQIKRPIALDEIKTQLDAGAYASFEDVKQDFETCFRNAKRYNIRDSQIWKDAKHLHKLVTKEYNKMAGVKEEGGGAEDGEDNGGAGHGSDDEGGKKKKAPNMNRLLKTRLQKLVEKTDDSYGPCTCYEFLEMPNKKLWAIYYKLIKRPQCLENIFKHLKRKEYHTAADFANDVELVFSNALEFNQEHTEIWEDALVLRDYFRQLMSDLPPQFSIPAYASTGEHTKLKLKVPAAPGHAPSLTATNSGSSPANPASSSGTTLRIPAHHTSVDGAAAHSPMALDAAKSPTITPKIPPTPTPAPPAHPAPSTPSLPPASAPHAAPQLHPKTPAPALSTGTLQPAMFTQPASYTSSPYYPNAAYQQQSSAAAPIAPAATPNPAIASLASPPLPAPQISSSASSSASAGTPHRPLYSVQLAHARSGACWTWTIVMACGRGGTPRCGRERRAGCGGAEQEEEKEAPKRRGKGRQKKGSAGVKAVEKAEDAKGKGKGKALQGDGGAAGESGEGKGEWDFELPLGSNVLEVGEKGVLPWRVYIDRATHDRFSMRSFL